MLRLSSFGGVGSSELPKIHGDLRDKEWSLVLAMAAQRQENGDSSPVKPSAYQLAHPNVRF